MAGDGFKEGLFGRNLGENGGGVIGFIFFGGLSGGWALRCGRFEMSTRGHVGGAVGIAAMTCGGPEHW